MICWLSFVDPNKAEGDRNLGVALVEIDDEDKAEALKTIREKFPYALLGAETVAAAILKAHLMACNPGGEVLCTPIPEVPKGLKLNRLYSRSELEALAPPEEAP